jgi:hypothetical protein
MLSGISLGQQRRRRECREKFGRRSKIVLSPSTLLSLGVGPASQCLVSRAGSDGRFNTLWSFDLAIHFKRVDAPNIRLKEGVRLKLWQ